jgi:hypothetical protein
LFFVLRSTVTKVVGVCAAVFVRRFNGSCTLHSEELRTIPSCMKHKSKGSDEGGVMSTDVSYCQSFFFFKLVIFLA